MDETYNQWKVDSWYHTYRIKVPNVVEFVQPLFLPVVEVPTKNVDTALDSRSAVKRACRYAYGNSRRCNKCGATSVVHVSHVRW